MGGFLVACWIFGFRWDWQQEFFLLWVEVAVVSDERNEGGRERKKWIESLMISKREESEWWCFFFAEWESWFQSRDGCLTFEREKTLVNRQYKLKLTMCVSHDTRISVTIDCCHLILFAATPPHKCAGNPCPIIIPLKNCDYGIFQ